MPLIGFTTGLTVFLYMIVFFGATRLWALRHEGHPLAEAWIGLF